ncbi:hypothetical protein RhiirA5_421038 [Rhizophagus irregularis]|uniref:Uncharacterized protein n=1 Tax=Rhizophagus irregularis TaxID=588596 RepID=A0A2I1ESP9_9GLOM|nr:hypothetical protein RhiirA5_421038 [Rhizophagus irregularis]PKY25141.1 hypothetical protein RhiirB3_439952 [Rhizophagus irregularis]
MSESQFPRSLFPQFTEEELQKASKISHSSVNWTEYNKWVKAGEPFKEHDELMSMNQKLKNGSTQRRLAGTKQYNIIRTRKQGNEISSNKSDGKANQKAQTTTCDETIYINQILQDLQRDGILNDVIGLEQVREFKYDKKSDEMKLVRPNIGFYNGMFSPAKITSTIKGKVLYEKLHSYFSDNDTMENQESSANTEVPFDVTEITTDDINMEGIEEIEDIINTSIQSKDIYEVQPGRNNALKSIALNILKYLPEDILHIEDAYKRG